MKYFPFVLLLFVVVACNSETLMEACSLCCNTIGSLFAENKRKFPDCSREFIKEHADEDWDCEDLMEFLVKAFIKFVGIHGDAKKLLEAKMCTNETVQVLVTEKTIVRLAKSIEPECEDKYLSINKYVMEEVFGIMYE